MSLLLPNRHPNPQVRRNEGVLCINPLASEVIVYVSEGVVEAFTNAAYSRDNNNRNQRSDEAVFDRGCAAFLF